MQEIFLLIHLLFTALECVALLVGEYGAALILRTGTAGFVVHCYWQRRKTSSGSSSSSNDSDRQRQYYTQLHYLFIAIDMMAYPLAVLALLMLPFRHSSTWLYLWLALMWLTVWLRLYEESLYRIQFTWWFPREYMETEKSRESV